MKAILDAVYELMSTIGVVLGCLVAACVCTAIFLFGVVLYGVSRKSKDGR